MAVGLGLVIATLMILPVPSLTASNGKLIIKTMNMYIAYES